jgi:hypothetical protein
LGKLAVKLGNDPKLTEAYANVATGQSKQQIIDTGNYLLGRSQNYSKLFWVPEGQSKEQGFFRGKFTNGT